MHARLAQSVERKALNLVVVGSSPTLGTSLFWHPRGWAPQHTGHKDFGTPWPPHIGHVTLLAPPGPHTHWARHSFGTPWPTHIGHVTLLAPPGPHTLGTKVLPPCQACILPRTLPPMHPWPWRWEERAGAAGGKGRPCAAPHEVRRVAPMCLFPVPYTPMSHTPNPKEQGTRQAGCAW